MIQFMLWWILVACGDDIPLYDGGSTQVASVCDSGSPDSGSPTLPWDIDDEFDSLDLKTWQEGTWTLGLTQLGPDQASVADGLLSLAHRWDDSVPGAETWRGAELYSYRTFTQGRFQARIAAPDEPGTVCSLFLYGTDADGLVHELDVELLSAEPDTVRVGTYAGWRKSDGYKAGPTRDTVTWQQGSFNSSDWHDYGISWDADAVTFDVDDVVIGSVTVVPWGAASLRLNHWTSSTWPEVGGPPAADSVCRVDWVRGRGGG